MVKRSPHKLRSLNLPINAGQRRRASKVVAEAWDSELKGRINTFNKDVVEYINTVVPSSSDHPFDPSLLPIPDDVFKCYNPVKGQEVASYPGLVSALYCFSSLEYGVFIFPVVTSAD